MRIQPIVFFLSLAVLMVAPNPLLWADPPADPDIEKFRKLPEDVQIIFEKAEQLELFSLEPMASKEKNSFHGYKTLGKTVVKDADVRKKIVAAVKRGVAESDGVAGCFHPRHGLRATHDDKTVDLVICFECLSIQVFVGDKAVTFVWTTGSPQKVLDKVLRDAKIPLAAKPKQD